MTRRKIDSKIKILYHQIKPDVYKDGKRVRAGLDCPDGIAAAWVALRKYPTADLVGCTYQSDLPIVNDGDLLIIVDFSFELEVLNQWRDRGCQIILIDHHKTLVDKVHEHTIVTLKQLLVDYLESYQESLIVATDAPILRDFIAFAKLTNIWTDILNNRDIDNYLERFCSVTSINQLFKYFSDGELNFDISKCGAVLTWEYFFPDEPVPAFLLYVQDRDLWQWLQPKSKEINEAFGHIRHGQTRNQIISEMTRLSGFSQKDLMYHFETLGQMLLAPKRERSQLLANNAHWVNAWGYRFLAAPLDSHDAFYYNEVMEILYTENPESPFVCTYINLGNEYKLSFRSRQKYDSFDVSKLARSLDGGGHENAAGAKLKMLPWIKEKAVV
jgi:hypothetical protein